MGRDGHLNVPEGWTVKPLIECTADQSISYGIVQPGSHVDNGIPIIRVNNFSNGSLDTSSVLKVAPIIEEKYSRTRLKGGEVLLTLVGSTGQSIVAPEGLRGWNVPRAIAVIRADNAIGARWINICLQSHATKSFLDAHANTTVQKTLNLKDVRQIPILVPPDGAKRFIESVICTLDDKIELNLRMNTTLEGMAQALFKSWFVDFDPVIDKALAAGHPIPEPLHKRAEARRALGEKRKPLPAKIVRHFPSRFVFSEEMGWVPEEWDVKQIKDFGSIICGKTPSKSNKSYYGDAIPFIKIPDMHHSAWISSTSDGLSLVGASSQAKKQIPANSICVSCIATVGKVVITSEDSHTNQQINSVVPHREEFKYYLYFTFLSMNKVLHDLASGGSATLNLNTGNFSKIEILSPSNRVSDAYYSSIDPLFQNMLANDVESKSLSNIRDTLLPKLLSGQLRIPDVEKLIEEAL